MSATYYLILTAYGSQRIAQLQADQSSAPLAVNFVAGDANGNPYLPQTQIAATALLNQRVSVPLQSVDVVDDDTCQAIAVLDATVGGFNIHEIGITDGTGQLIYIGNYHGGYKPTLSEGAGGDLTLVLDLVATGLGTVIISPDPSFVYAGQDWVDANFVRIPTFTAHVAQNTLEHIELADDIYALAIATQNTIDALDATITNQQQQIVSDIDGRFSQLLSFLNNYFGRKNDGVYPAGEYLLTLAPRFEMTITLVGGGGSGGAIRSYAHDFSGDMWQPSGNGGEDTQLRLLGQGYLAVARGGLGGQGAYCKIGGDPYYSDISLPSGGVGGRGISLTPSNAPLIQTIEGSLGVGGPIGGDGAASTTDISGALGFLVAGQTVGGGSAGSILLSESIYSGGGSAAGIITISLTNLSTTHPKTFLLVVGKGGKGVSATFDDTTYSTGDAQDGLAFIQSNPLTVLT